VSRHGGVVVVGRDIRQYNATRSVALSKGGGGVVVVVVFDMSRRGVVVMSHDIQPTRYGWGWMVDGEGR
jgi:hypothetical protein